jgi:hypothetical protein
MQLLKEMWLSMEDHVLGRHCAEDGGGWKERKRFRSCGHGVLPDDCTDYLLEDSPAYLSFRSLISKPDIIKAVQKCCKFKFTSKSYSRQV